MIEWYDKCCLKVNRDGEPNLLVYKPNIKYMFKAEELVGDKDAPSVDHTYTNPTYMSQHPWDHVEGAPYGTRGGMVVAVASDGDDRIAALADHVLHLAPPPSRGASDTRTRALLQALARGGRVRRLVYASTSGVYGDCGGARVSETRSPAAQSARAARRRAAAAC